MSEYQKLSKADAAELQNAGHRLRIDSIVSTTAAGSGHPSSCTSAADIMSVLFKKYLRYDVNDPGNAAADRFVLSKGHAAPVLYAAMKEVGNLTEPLTNLRKFTSDLEGHPPTTLSFVDVATGSLGQGLANACGMAWIAKNIDKAPYRVFCMMGDGESAEGSVWEAMQFASHYKLDNLCAIIDVNRLGQSEATALGHEMEIYRARGEAWGMNTLVIDGHDVNAIDKAFHEAEITKGKPTLIIAKTFKGKHMPEQEDRDNWHGKPMSQDFCDKIVKHIEGLMEATDAKITPRAPLQAVENRQFATDVKLSSPPSYEKTDKVATRKAYGTALTKLGDSSDRVIAFDGDTKNSTFSIDFMNKYPDRFGECFIAEQLLAGVTIGATCRNRSIAFASTFSAFFSRAADQIRMGAISKTNANFVGSHAGVSIGEDGPSQMALEDLAFFRAIPGSTVFYPSDAVSCERAVEIAANTEGVCFIRTSRPATVNVHANDAQFAAGKAHFVRNGKAAAIFGSGITLHNALEAAETLAKEGIEVSVIDPFTIKPMDVNVVKKAVEETGGKLITVEDHYAFGGLHSAVSEVVCSEGLGAKVKSLAVPGVSRSGKAAELMAAAKIDAAAIVEAVKSF